MSDNRERTQSITFRLPKKVLEQVELEAKQNNVSENVLVRQILVNHLEWTKFSRGMGILPMTRESFRLVTRGLGAEEIGGIVDSMCSLIKTLSLVRSGRYDLKEALESLSLYMKMSNFSFIEIKDKDEYRFLIKHDLGMVWSLILEQFLKRALGEFVKGPIRFKTSDASVIVSVNLP